MAIDNTQIVKFANEEVRIVADVMLSAYRTAKTVMQDYYARPEIGSACTTGIAEDVLDGAETDGRPIITGNDVLAVITRASEIVADMEAGNNAKLNTLIRVAVNGQSRV